MKLAKFSAKLVANFRRSLEGDFRASFAGENGQKHFPPKFHCKFHHQTSLRGSGLWRALKMAEMAEILGRDPHPKNGWSSARNGYQACRHFTLKAGENSQRGRGVTALKFSQTFSSKFITDFQSEMVKSPEVPRTVPPLFVTPLPMPNMLVC